jgi:hypothetical protein
VVVGEGRQGGRVVLVWECAPEQLHEMGGGGKTRDYGPALQVLINTTWPSSFLCHSLCCWLLAWPAKSVLIACCWQLLPNGIVALLLVVALLLMALQMMLSADALYALSLSPIHDVSTENFGRAYSEAWAAYFTH